jgi:2-dehydropantoate 2-reductase
MRILVMGAGGVGGYYGAMLAHAGNDVTFVARGAHLAAMREKGLELRSQGQTVRIAPARAVGDPAEVGEVDLALFTVKTYDTESAARALRPAIGPGTAVLTLQNGIDSVDVLGRILGEEHVLAGVTLIAAAVVEPGVVQENGFSRKVILGEARGEISERVDRVADVLRAASLEVETTASARQAIWDKFVLVAAHATVSAACQTPIGVTRKTGEAMALYHRMFREVIALGRAEGLRFAPDMADRLVATFMGAPEGQTSSMQRDFANGRRVELEALTGAVVRRAGRLGVAVPSFDALYAVLKVRARTFGGLPGDDAPDA